jgi:hypothetical protein
LSSLIVSDLLLNDLFFFKNLTEQQYLRCCLFYHTVFAVVAVVAIVGHK